MFYISYKIVAKKLVTEYRRAYIYGAIDYMLCFYAICNLCGISLNDYRAYIKCIRRHFHSHKYQGWTWAAEWLIGKILAKENDE